MFVEANDSSWIEKDTLSWAPDWHNTFRALYGSSEPKYRASERTVPGVRFSADGKLCICAGVIIDTINGFTRPHWPDWESRPEAQVVMKPPVNDGANLYADREGIQDALWRSLVGNRELWPVCAGRICSVTRRGFANL
jgi:hypothetical protein